MVSAAAAGGMVSDRNANATIKRSMVVLPNHRSDRGHAARPPKLSCREVLSLGERNDGVLRRIPLRVQSDLIEGARIISFRPGSGVAVECCAGAWGRSFILKDG